ncbi:hypothetical protein ACHAXH_006113 [Discostella pseudostelligera]
MAVVLLQSKRSPPKLHSKGRTNRWCNQIVLHGIDPSFSVASLFPTVVERFGHRSSKQVLKPVSSGTE